MFTPGDHIYTHMAHIVISGGGSGVKLTFTQVSVKMCNDFTIKLSHSTESKNLETCIPGVHICAHLAHVLIFGGTEGKIDFHQIWRNRKVLFEEMVDFCC